MDWAKRGVKVVHSDELDLNTPQTSGMTRAAAITHARTGASKLWAGTMLVQPDARTGPHHHGELETVLYVVRGRIRMRWGDQLEFSEEARPGDFIYVPPYVPHHGDQCQPRRYLRSCSCKRRTGSDCCQFGPAHSRTRQCGAWLHAVSPRSLIISGRKKEKSQEAAYFKAGSINVRSVADIRQKPPTPAALANVPMPFAGRASWRSDWGISPSRCILAISVVLGKPSLAAAPLLPPTTPFVSRRVSTM